MKHIKFFFTLFLVMVAATASAQYVHIKLNNGKTYDYDSRDIKSFVVNMTPPATLDNEPDEPTETMAEAITVTASAENIYVGSTVKGTAQMSVSVSPDNATNKEVEWSSNNESIATVDANGLVTAKAAGQVTIIATAKDGSGVKGEKQLTVAANSVVSTSEPIYGTPTITATYTEIEADGSNNATPTVTYKQTAEVTDTYADGSTQKRSLSNVTTGGTVTYTKKSGTATVGTDGKVSASASTNTSKHSVAVVTVSVTLNGKTDTKEVTVYQKAYVAPPVLWYIGNVSKTAAQFAEMSVEELLASVTKSADITTKKLENNSINKSVWYVMIPDTVDVKGAQFSAGGITSPFTADEIKTPTKFKGVHEDVTIDGKTYKVYGYRNTAFESTAADGFFEII